MRLRLLLALTLGAFGIAAGAGAQGLDNPAGYDAVVGSTPSAAAVACAPGDLCGLIGPYPNTHWVADGEWHPQLNLTGWCTVDATSSSIVFMNPQDCSVLFTCTPAAFTTSYRAFAWGMGGGDMWVSGWNAPVALFHLDIGCNLIAQFDVGIQIAGLAMDFANGHLWAMQRSPVGGPNSMLFEYDITSGTPILKQGPIPVLWGGTAQGIGSAGLEYDNTNCTIVALRQDSGNIGVSSIEVFFDLDPPGVGGVLWIANCSITTTAHCSGPGTFINHPWGIALNEGAPPNHKITITDIDLTGGVPTCAIPAAGAGPIDVHYYSVPTSPGFCVTTAVEPSTWGAIKALHQ